jgi:molybdenum-dependent DNA-binding transcriptional regulator ModE
MDGLTIGNSIWIDSKNRSMTDKGGFGSLKLINKTGLLPKATRKMKMSYKAA